MRGDGGTGRAGPATQRPREALVLAAVIACSAAPLAAQELVTTRIALRTLAAVDSMRRLGIEFPDGRFGDLIFLAEPGIIILPSHMGSEGVAAMHGYHPDVEEMSSLMLSSDALPTTAMSLTDVAALICPGFEPAGRSEAS